MACTDFSSPGTSWRSSPGLGVTGSRGTQTAPYTGHAEAWFNRADLMTMANVPEAARAMELAIEDEAKFIDFKRSAMWIGKERVFIDRR